MFISIFLDMPWCFHSLNSPGFANRDFTLQIFEERTIWTILGNLPWNEPFNMCFVIVVVVILIAFMVASNSGPNFEPNRVQVFKMIVYPLAAPYLLCLMVMFGWKTTMPCAPHHGEQQTQNMVLLLGSFCDFYP